MAGVSQEGLELLVLGFRKREPEKAAPTVRGWRTRERWDWWRDGSTSRSYSVSAHIELTDEDEDSMRYFVFVNGGNPPPVGTCRFNSWDAARAVIVQAMEDAT